MKRLIGLIMLCLVCLFVDAGPADGTQRVAELAVVESPLSDTADDADADAVPGSAGGCLLVVAAQGDAPAPHAVRAAAATGSAAQQQHEQLAAVDQQHQ